MSEERKERRSETRGLRVSTRGVLLVISLDDWRIEAAGGDPPISLPPSDAAGRRVKDVLGEAATHALRNLAQSSAWPGASTWSLFGPGTLPSPFEAFGGALRLTDRFLLLELERETAVQAMTPGEIAAAAARVDDAPTVGDRLRAAAQMLRARSGWDGAAIWGGGPGVPGTLASAGREAAAPPRSVRRRWTVSGRTLCTEGEDAPVTPSDLFLPKAVTEGGLAAASPEERAWLDGQGLAAAVGFELRCAGRNVGSAALMSRTSRRLGPGARAGLSLLARHAAGWAAAVTDARTPPREEVRLGAGSRFADAPSAFAESPPRASETPAFDRWDKPLARLRVLIVEDDALQAMDLQEMALSLGADEVALADSAADALSMIAMAPPQAALLDNVLLDGSSRPVAERLAALGLPFAVTSGASASSLPPILANAPRLTKPASTAAMRSVLSRLLRR
ncbi:MAG: hypothetical protein AAF676_00650 [Pseudomonadota bacterium]